jgi:hypothetical protein
MSYVRTLGDDTTAHIVRGPHLKSLRLTGWLMRADLETALQHVPESLQPLFRELLDQLETA